METETLLKKKPVQLGFTSAETEEIVKDLNILLANYQVHLQKMRNFHWNIKGKNFFDLHKKFEEFYTSANNRIDTIAERVRVFGGIPVSTLKDCLEKAEIKEAAGNLNSENMVQETMKDLEILISHMVNVSNTAVEKEDVGTDDLMLSMIRKLEKTHWMLNSWNMNV